MQLWDTHCHLNLNNFAEDLAEVLLRAHQAGVSRILVPGIDLQTSQQALDLAEKHPEIYAAVGIHPNDGLTWTEETLPRLRQLAAHPKCVAIGEIGLDYYRDRCPRDLQQTIFQAQLKLAGEMNLPVIIHNREALPDLWPILASWQRQLAADRSPLAGRPGVLHSYEGTLEGAHMAIQHNFRIGLNGPVTFKNAAERQFVAAGLPGSSILLETDAPFLTPHPQRGKRNEPSFLQFINTKVAALREVSADHLAETTFQNADQLFLGSAA